MSPGSTCPQYTCASSAPNRQDRCKSPSIILIAALAPLPPKDPAMQRSAVHNAEHAPLQSSSQCKLASRTVGDLANNDLNSEHTSAVNVRGATMRGGGKRICNRTNTETRAVHVGDSLAGRCCSKYVRTRFRAALRAYAICKVLTSGILAPSNHRPAAGGSQAGRSAATQSRLPTKIK